MSKLKILLLVRSLGYGGSERQLVELAKGLHRRGHSIKVVTYYPGGPLKKDLQESGISVMVVHKQGKWDICFFLARLAKVIRKEDPDIIHGYLPISNLAITILKPLFPHKPIVWGVRASYVDFGQYGWLHRIVFKVECLFSRFADLIIVNSHAGKSYYSKHGIPQSKMIVIPNGIDTNRFNTDLTARELLRGQWGFANEEIIIGIVGRLDPMKDHPTFLKAAALLAKDRADVKFVCIGDGSDEYRKHLQALAENLGLGGLIVWAGVRNDMNAVYNALDVATSSSLGEGFSNVIGEAMASGTPCVVTNVGDSALVVGDAGHVIPVRDPMALSKAWQELIGAIRTSRRVISEKARRRIVEQFNVNVLVTRTEAVLRDMV